MLPKKNTIIFICAVGLCLSLSTAAATIKLKVVVETGIVRFEPRLSSRILATLPKGSILETEGIREGWYIVSIRSQETGFLLTGYIQAESVEKISESPKDSASDRKEIPLQKPIPKTSQPQVPASKTAPKKKTVEPADIRRFGLKLTGGYVFLYPENINNAISGRNAFLVSTFQEISPDISITGDPSEIKSGFHFQSSFEYLIFPNFQLELGCAALFTSSKNEVQAKRIFYNYESAVADHSRISLFPLNLTLNFLFPIQKGLNFSLFLGGEYSFARYVDSRETTTLLGLSESWERREIRASAQGFGLHSGFGFAFQLSPSLFFVVEGRGRLLTIKDFEGKVTITDSTGFSNTEEGTLYTYSRWYPHGTYSFVDLYPTAPSTDNDYDVNKAKIELSGLFFSAGFKIRF